MKINKDITNLILETIPKYYRYENEFFKKNGIKFPDNNWQKFKNGETAIEKMGASRVANMIDDLFTPYEQMLIAEAQIEYYFSNRKLTIDFPSFFIEFKKKHLMEWLKIQPKKVVGGINRKYTAQGNMTTTFLRIEIENTFYQMDFKFNVDKVPAGRENRLKWIQNNLGELR